MPHREQWSIHTKNARVLYCVSRPVRSLTFVFIQLECTFKNVNFPQKYEITSGNLGNAYIAFSYKYFNLFTSLFYWLLIINLIPVLIYSF